MLKEEIISIMPSPLREMFLRLEEEDYKWLQEIRLRVGQPVLLRVNNQELGINLQGKCEVKYSYQVIGQDIEGLLKYLSGFSLYALEDEIRQGYVTIRGGHRIGLSGKMVVENMQIKTMKYINSINIRIAHQIIGCSKRVMPYLVSREKVYHTLIVSPPKCGKTTLLRDIVRYLSEGYSGYGPYRVGVVDERSEIAGCYQGIPQNDVGMRTDVLDGCPKIEGMKMLLRAMSPEVIAVDEIGKEGDLLALQEVLSAGVSIISTVHGKNIEDCKHRPLLKELLGEGLFERIILLSNRQGPCTIEGILEGRTYTHLSGG
ncbi:stage III sporulation protein AA [Sporanaerobium hydrogeniformans]|uniref:Stage III sporulation protein AA n=1 Tax=Sporanaerobium hydrogeniformans TaxID=3072179 RepID=A0AC61DGH5_9FIRM|nr:stage III sporulation protein AA [Sporanaerobium hydrogeniformans]PHV72354.1 stage III sporulation protein AA [Sporanaerobium hydrogeniformans]